MRLVIDIDNTLVDYRKSIRKSLLSRNFQLDIEDDFLDIEINKIKKIIRDQIGDSNWQYIQGDIYSDQSQNVNFYQNSREALKQFIYKGYEIYLISHKTKYGIKDSKNVNILSIAQTRIFNWIMENNLGKGIKSIIFCDSIEEKLEMIYLIHPQVIIDDLLFIHEKIQLHNIKQNKALHILFNGKNIKNLNSSLIIERNNIIEANNWINIPNMIS
tara:strand:+ start:3887 stop:4531 length:645 start_codon:yes stop_codon:yes gene_type:complete